MASNAINPSMGAGEGEGGWGMVKCSLRPAFWHMASGTVLSSVTRVHIALLMAGNAVLGRIPKLPVNVAGPALGLLVLPF
jgi:hypothetical protein